MADLTTQPEGLVSTGNSKIDETPKEEALAQRDSAKRNDKWKARIEASRRYREQRMQNEWRDNVNYRMQRPYGEDEGDSLRDKLSSPEDWSRTKQKTAQLMFQVPKIVAKGGRPELEAVAPTVSALINDVLTKECQATFALDENLSDVVNAAGIMACVVGIDQRFETKMVAGPEVMLAPAQMRPGGQVTPPIMVPGKQVPVQVKISQRFTLDRISPALFLWPPEFRTSNWDKAPWTGYETWMAKPVVRRTWKLDDTQAADIKTSQPPELLSKEVDDEQKHYDTVDYVKVTIIWARASEFDDSVAHPDCFKRVVFIDGITEPVEDAKTDWQVWVEETPEIPGQPDPDTGELGPPTPAVPAHYHGITKSPIRVGTLTYVSDIGVPPSDSEAGRPQVREIIRGRSQMLRQRDTSLPIRWYDVNRLDDLVADGLRDGTWQDMIPVNGPGDHVIGEVARASFPGEDFEFQSIVTKDLDRAWALSNNQLGSSQSGRRSAKEIETIQQAGDIRLDYEKGRVSRFVVGIAEVLFGLLQRFLDSPRYVQIVGQKGADELARVDRTLLSGSFAFDFLADSSDRVDIGTQLQSALKLYNLLGNSPSVNREELEKEIVQLHGLDPSRIIGPPPEPKDDPPNISYRFSGEDMLNPLAVALLLKSEELKPSDIAMAAKVIQDAMKQVGNPQTLPDAPPDGGPPPAGPAAPDVKPPIPPEPITKRLTDGTRVG